MEEQRARISLLLLRDLWGVFNGHERRVAAGNGKRDMGNDCMILRISLFLMIRHEVSYAEGSGMTDQPLRRLDRKSLAIWLAQCRRSLGLTSTCV